MAAFVGGSAGVLMDDGATAAAALLRNGWLEEFIRLPAENADWLEPATPGLYLKDNPPARRLFIPVQLVRSTSCGGPSPFAARGVREHARRGSNGSPRAAGSSSADISGTSSAATRRRG